MKKCAKCKNNFPIENFPFAGGYRRSYCLECWKEKNREYRKIWFNNHKKECIAQNNISKKERVKNHILHINNLKIKCSICGYNKCKSALDFHHKDISKKEYNISIMIQRGHSLQKILKEIEKCIVVCSNCHREIHEPPVAQG